MNFDTLYKSKYVHLLVIAFIACAFIAEPRAVLQNDLDSAVRWASNHLFHIGHDDLFLFPHTNGPLFSLKFPISQGKGILVAVLFDVCIKFLLGWYLLSLSKIYRPTNYWLPIAVFLAFCVFLSFDFVIIAIVLATCLLALHYQKLPKLVPGIIVLSLSIFIKASISFPALFIFGSTVLLLFIQKKVTHAIGILSIFLGSFIALTFILYGYRMDGFLWVFRAFIRTLGYGSDQAIFFNNFIPYIILTVSFIILPIFFIRNKTSKQFFFITALAIFSIWKYALGRQDFIHYKAWFILCILLAGFIVLFNDKRGAIIGAGCYLLSFGFFSTNAKRAGGVLKQSVYNTARVDYLPKVLFRYDKIKEEYQQRSAAYLDSTILSDTILQLIGNQTVDVFPWGLSVLYKYKLNYMPRINFHSTLLGSQADAKDAEHFQDSKEAPEFILWHHSQPAKYTLNGHDKIYLPNTTPKAMGSIVKNYKLVRYEMGYALWQKEKEKALPSHETILPKIIKTNQWFQAPTVDSNQAIYGGTNFELSITDKIRSFLYKGRFFKILYKLKNGQTVVHFLSRQSLQSGFLLQPYFTNPTLDYETVDQIMIKPMHSKFSNKSLQLEHRSELCFSFQK